MKNDLSVVDGGVVKEYNKLRIVSEEFHSLQSYHWSLACFLVNVVGTSPGAKGLFQLALGVSTRIHAAGAQ